MGAAGRACRGRVRSASGLQGAGGSGFGPAGAARPPWLPWRLWAVPGQPAGTQPLVRRGRRQSSPDLRQGPPPRARRVQACAAPLLPRASSEPRAWPRSPAPPRAQLLRVPSRPLGPAAGAATWERGALVGTLLWADPAPHPGPDLPGPSGAAPAPSASGREGGGRAGPEAAPRAPTAAHSRRRLRRWWRRRRLGPRPRAAVLRALRPAGRALAAGLHSAAGPAADSRRTRGRTDAETAGGLLGGGGPLASLSPAAPARSRCFSAPPAPPAERLQGLDVGRGSFQRRAPGSLPPPRSPLKAPPSSSSKKPPRPRHPPPPGSPPGLARLLLREAPQGPPSSSSGKLPRPHHSPPSGSPPRPCPPPSPGSPPDLPLLLLREAPRPHSPLGSPPSLALLLP